MSVSRSGEYQAPVPVVNIANILTVLRIVFTPVFVVILLHDNGLTQSWRWGAFALFCLLMFTDRLDGQLARSRNLITDFGKIADPIADKALILGALISLSIIGQLWWWVTIIIAIRELGITIWRILQLKAGRVVPASKGGKLKTATQTLAIGLLIIPNPHWIFWFGAVVMAAALLSTVVSGVQYLSDARKLNT